MPELLSIAGDFGRRPMRGTVLGDSIVSGSYNLLNFINVNCPSIFMAENAGVGGNTTTAMLARINTDVGVYSSTLDFCFILATANDASGGVTLATHVANMRAIILNLISRGIMPVMLLGPPKDTNTQTVMQYRLADLVLAEQYGIPCFDPWTSYIDPINGKWTSGASSDGTHPTKAVEKAAGEALGTAIKNGTGATYRPLCDLNYAGQVATPLFNVDTNADGAADNWIKYGTGTMSLASAAGDGYLGKWQSMAATNINSGFYADFAATPGNYYVATAVVDTAIVSGSPTFGAWVRWQGGGRDDYLVTLGSTVEGRVRASIGVTAPVGTTSGKFFFDVRGTSSPAGTIKAAEAQVYDITAALAGA